MAGELNLRREVTSALVVQREMARAEHQYCVRDDEICADFRAFRARVLALGSA